MWASERMTQSAAPPQAPGFNCRMGTEMPATVITAVRTAPVLAVARRVAVAGPEPEDAPETVSQEGSPVNDQAQPLAVLIRTATLPPEAGTERLLVLTAYSQVEPDVTTNRYKLDCCPSGLLTRIAQVPAVFRVTVIWNEVEVMFWIWLPLMVKLVPEGGIAVTVRPLWNPLP